MGLSIHSVPCILPIAALMCAGVSSGLITRTFHQPFSKFLILSSIIIIVLVFGYSEATYTSYTRISSLHNKLACGYFLIK